MGCGDGSIAGWGLASRLASLDGGLAVLLPLINGVGRRMRMPRPGNRTARACSSYPAARASASAVALALGLRFPGGNIAGIFASRSASAFHKREQQTGAALDSDVVTLALLAAPTHAVFLAAARLLLPSHTRILTFAFAALFVGASTLQVVVVLLVAHSLANAAARANLDPDNHVVPYVTALSDLLGTVALLSIAGIVA